MSTPQAQRFEALRQDIDNQDITGSMRHGSEMRVEIDETPGGGIDGADLYTQELIEFRPISQSDGVVAPKDIRETWIKGNKQFDFEIRVRPICPSCNTLMGVGNLPDHLMGQCYRCLVQTCPRCVNECITCGKMMCNQHSLGHGVQGGPLCSLCLQHVLEEEEWQRQLDAYSIGLEKMQKQMDHREVMDQIRREDERDRRKDLLEYYKHQNELDAEMIRHWQSEVLEHRRFEEELEQQERESLREHGREMEDMYLREREIENEHQRANREMDIQEDENKRKHNREMYSNRTEREKVDKKHQRENKKIDKKHDREMYSNRTERKKMNKKHRREDKKIDKKHDREMYSNRTEREKVNKKHNRESRKISNEYDIKKQEQNRKDRDQKDKKKKAERMMDLRETLKEKGYRRKPPRRTNSKSKKKKSGVPIDIQ